jgi:hypothetical protein
MIRAAKLYDVFLSSSLEDMELGASVARQLSNAGLSVFFEKSLHSGAGWAEKVWQALGESSAFVLVLAKPVVPANVGVELGAAMAWSKPIFTVRPASATTELPEFLERYKSFSVDDLEGLADAIGKTHHELSDRERDLLKALYLGASVPTDQLLVDHSRLELLAREFNKKARTNYSGVRLLQELLRLRKTRGLPRVRKVAP